MIYVAFLRGINVGGHRKIKMQDLKSSLSQLALQQVSTYIQSGNVVFKTEEENVDILNENIESKILDDFGFEVKVVLRNENQITSILRNNPYLSSDGDNINNCYVNMLAKSPDDDKIKNLLAYTHPPDEYRIVGDNIFLNCANGYGKSKLTNDFFEKKLGLYATTRNWKTMLKMKAMLDEISSNE